jgi:hypothetical protein
MVFKGARLQIEIEVRKDVFRNALSTPAHVQMSANFLKIRYWTCLMQFIKGERSELKRSSLQTSETEVVEK